jgi:hypothetical protein
LVPIHPPETTTLGVLDAERSFGTRALATSCASFIGAKDLFVAAMVDRAILKRKAAGLTTAIAGRMSALPQKADKLADVS